MKSIFQYSFLLAILLLISCNSRNENASEPGDSAQDDRTETAPRDREEDPGEEGDEQAEESADQKLRIHQPIEGETISSPVNITGEAPGNWFFEGELIVYLQQNGEELSEAIADAEGEWMTTDFVSFTATLEFGNAGQTGSAALVFEKSNPSGRPELDENFTWPVQIVNQ